MLLKAKHDHNLGKLFLHRLILPSLMPRETNHLEINTLFQERSDSELEYGAGNDDGTGMEFLYLVSANPAANELSKHEHA